ncbi:Sua5 YciO YrdC YwlC family protein [Lacticaseibacillus pantheris DSM 15945 = JCM 12539 = NBRC 106106]|uniref:Threonylcarbamoyl-AMP synthase n=1 Tax=Lacticaseibacillus pantheris DSM 15945 = JCM 12539 = NBRC 106106 TaxID=1423783 RepID=A0A0R1TZC0_9LACO|nr:L-threonylcarbamoyladenylate synthase [Lacticaseibacillus pantheris]KRL86553.1 Sua5 YciO YrdC YwlC family protein [Lacticaseibacillus pantheris DSM 15945 = JCM 12539 = NBRC 106106]
MQTTVFTRDTVADAAALLRAGELVAFPTETVYGLGADATNVTAVKKVYAAKGRPSDNPLIVTVADIDTVRRFADVTPAAEQLMRKYWPGPLTIILNIIPGALDATVTGGLQTAAFRCPDNAATRELIRLAGNPIVGPSANLSGKPSPTTAQHVLHDMDGRIAGILDDGPARVGVESTVLDMSGNVPAILRPGFVDEEMLTADLGAVNTDQHHVGAKETPKAPGMKYKHYAPDAQVVIVDHLADFPAAIEWARADGRDFGVLATDQVLAQVPAGVETYSLGRDLASATRDLFAGLRYFDLHPDVSLVLAQGFDQEGLGAAYMNRINKSAGGEHFPVTES